MLGSGTPRALSRIKRMRGMQHYANVWNSLNTTRSLLNIKTLCQMQSFCASCNKSFNPDPVSHSFPNSGELRDGATQGESRPPQCVYQHAGFQRRGLHYFSAKLFSDRL